MMDSHDLSDIINEVYSLVLPHLNNSNVTWKMLSGEQHCYVNCIRDQIIEVFLNVFMNAIEAMQPVGGSLSVEIIQSADKSQVGVKIIDSGPGIDVNILPHIFEPFTTTKGGGLGLGLSISYEIVQKHGGQITVDNQFGQGATFTIWLPIDTGAGEKGE
jgi:signal transduction histidine kinase